MRAIFHHSAMIEFCWRFAVGSPRPLADRPAIAVTRIIPPVCVTPPASQRHMFRCFIFSHVTHASHSAARRTICGYVRSYPIAVLGSGRRRPPPAGKPRSQQPSAHGLWWLAGRGTEKTASSCLPVSLPLLGRHSSQPLLLLKPSACRGRRPQGSRAQFEGVATTSVTLEMQWTQQ